MARDDAIYYDRIDGYVHYETFPHVLCDWFFIWYHSRIRQSKFDLYDHLHPLQQ